MKKIHTILLILIISTILSSCYGEPFDLAEFDKEHQTSFSDTGYNYVHYKRLFSNHWLFKGNTNEDWLFSRVDIFSSPASTQMTQSDDILLDEGDYSVSGYDIHLKMYKDIENRGPIYRFSFERNSDFFIVFILYQDQTVKFNRDAITQEDLDFISRFLDMILDD